MTQHKLAQPMTVFKKKRLEAGLSVAEVAQRAHVDRTTVWRIEEAVNANPHPESLLAIGRALQIPYPDMFAAFGWLPRHELPTLGPYLRAKYDQLPTQAIQEIEEQFAVIAAKYGISLDPTADTPLDQRSI